MSNFFPLFTTFLERVHSANTNTDIHAETGVFLAFAVHLYDVK